MSTTKTKIVGLFFRSEENSMVRHNLYFNDFKSSEWKIATDKLSSQEVWLGSVLGSLRVFKNVNYYKYFIPLLKSLNDIWAHPDFFLETEV